MEPETNNVDMNKLLAERFATLPKVVQDAITSADVQDHMRKLAETQKLHVDQWQILENDVMLTLLGFQPVGELAEHLEKDLELPTDRAKELAAAISETVFAPIRGEMEKALSHPTPIQETESTIDTMRREALETAHADETAAAQSAQPAVAPATPPTPAPDTKAVRGEIAQSYIGTKSHERRSIEGDPYREQLL